MIWFTADWHIDHANIIQYCNRPFSSVEEMNQVIFDNNFSVFQKTDTVYYIGDLVFGSERRAEFILSKFPRNTFFIKGNHDNSAVIRVAARMCQAVWDLKRIRIEKQHIVLCHWAMRVWDLSHHGSWQCYAHSHAELPPIGLQHDVGVDNNNFKPVNFDMLKEIMASKEVPDWMAKSKRG